MMVEVPKKGNRERYMETFAGDVYVPYLDCDGGFTSIDIDQNGSD